MKVRGNTLVTALSLGATRLRKVAVVGTLLLGLGASAAPVSAQAQSGRLITWGSDQQGQVLFTPTGSAFIAVAAGASHSVALRSDGSLVSWGADVSGVTSNTPTGTGFIAVAAGAVHSVALRADGSLVSWGRDDSGVTGNTPTGTGFKAVAAGYGHSVALRADGSLVSWGLDNLGQVFYTPTGTGFKAVAAGDGHSVALRSDGSLVSWGRYRTAPPGTGFLAVAAGKYHGVALRSDGSLVSWGDDGFGQVSGTPTGTGFKAIEAGGYHSVALRSDGNLVSWGLNNYGQVGNTPAGTGFLAVAAGDYFGVAIKANQAPVAKAGAAQTVTIAHDGSPATNTASFTLNGSGSDPDGDPITYQWKQGGKVVGSTATLTLSRPAGSYTFILTVTDYWGASSSANVKVTVNPEPNRAPGLSVPASLWTNVGSLILFGITAADPDGDPVSLSLVSPSPGSIGLTGIYTWTPVAPGNYSVTVKATDSYGSSTTKTVAVTVSALIVENVSLTRSGANVTLKFNLRKPGSVDGTNVKITSATLGGVNTGTPLPVVLNTIKAGTSKTVTLGFNSVAAGSATFVVNGTSANGPIYAKLTVTVP